MDKPDAATDAATGAEPVTTEQLIPTQEESRIRMISPRRPPGVGDPSAVF
jgi:hypothetical protein